jgi:hypothetical protein
VLAHQVPVAALRFDAEAGPQVEPLVDDRLAPRQEYDAGIGLAVGMRTAVAFVQKRWPDLKVPGLAGAILRAAKRRRGEIP